LLQRAFADRNAAEVDGGRDFHPHMDRLTQAIDRIAGPDLQHHGTDATRGEPARDAATGDAARGRSPDGRSNKSPTQGQAFLYYDTTRCD
jgi:hypothetical protein